MDDLRQDMRYALRALWSNRLIALVAVLSLGLGIGATSSIFAAVDVFMLRPLPYPQADRLVVAWTTNEDRGFSRVSYSAPDFQDSRRLSTSVDLTAYHSEGANLSGSDVPERLTLLRVSANFFAVLEVAPSLGRGFNPEDSAPRAAPVAVIGDGLWHRTFGSDPGIVGRTVSLDGRAHTIVGVMPPRFVFESSAVDLWAPLVFTGEEDRSSHWVRVLGRIQDGYTLAQARAEIDGIARGLADAHPGTNTGNGASLIRLRDDWFDEGFRQGSVISSVAALFVLLIACANVANLLLARGAGRRQEIALRSALGAVRLRIVRQLLTESVFLALMGGALGGLLSVYGIRGIQSLLPAWYPQRDAVALDERVLFFTVVASLVAGIIFGLAPALRTSRANYRDALQDGGGGRGGTGGRSARLRGALVVAEVTLSMALLVASGLLIKSFAGLRTAAVGFDTEEVMTARVTLSEGRYPEADDVETFHRDLLARLEGLPGVARAAGAHVLPTQGNSASYYAIPSEGPLDFKTAPVTSFRSVTPGYFEVMGIGLLSGRPLAVEDAEEEAAVTVVSQAFADRHWPDADPLGERIELTTGIHEIVGVAENTWDFGPEDDPVVMIYLPSYSSRSLGVVVRASSAPRSLIRPIREQVLSLDPDQPVYEIQTLAYMMREEISGYWAMVSLLGVLGAIALALSLAGVYGVMAYSVSLRTREVGIRMALGAQRGDVLRLVVRQGSLIGLTGIGLGAGLALATARGLSWFLVGVSPFDPVPFAATATLLMAAALVATYLPARRAAMVNPVQALRGD